MTVDDESLLTRVALVGIARDEGIDLERQQEVVFDLAAIGLTHLIWRNTKLEDAHAGGMIDDADMFAANVMVWRALRSAMGASRIDWWAMAEFISDPEMQLPNGRTIRATMRGYGWRALAQASPKHPVQSLERLRVWHSDPAAVATRGLRRRVGSLLVRHPVVDAGGR